MARVTYSAQTKAAIIKATLDARSADKTWAEAHAIAKKEGYKGNVLCLIKLVNRKKSAKKRGRPAKVKVVGKASATGLDTVEAIVRRVVQQRVDAALDKAIAVLAAMKS
jgi:hypothetical protein